MSNKLKQISDLAKKKWNNLQKTRSAEKLEIQQAYIEYLEADREYLISFYEEKINEKGKQKEERKKEERKPHIFTKVDDRTLPPLRSSKLYVPIDNKNLDFDELEDVLKIIRGTIEINGCCMAVTRINNQPTILIQSPKDLKYEDIDTSKLVGIPFAIQQHSGVVVAASDNKKEHIESDIKSDDKEYYSKNTKLYVPINNKNLSVYDLINIIETLRDVAVGVTTGISFINDQATLVITSPKDLKYEDIDTSKLVGIPFAIQQHVYNAVFASANHSSSLHSGEFINKRILTLGFEDGWTDNSSIDDVD